MIKLLKSLAHFQAKQIRRLESMEFSGPKNFAAIASFSAQTASIHSIICELLFAS